jgi:hypothetical protein
MQPSGPDRLIEAFFADGYADKVARFAIPPESEARLQTLREKANEGGLTADEEREYHRFVELLDLLGLLKVEAQHLIQRHAS